MKKLLFCTTVALASLALFVLASIPPPRIPAPPITFHRGPEDERLPPWPVILRYDFTLGWLAQTMDVMGLADVIEHGEGIPGHEFFEHGFVRLCVVNAIYGCTNNQELFIQKPFPTDILPPSEFDYYPTNNSRFVFGTQTNSKLEFEDWSANLKKWNSADWQLPPQPEIISTPTEKPGMLLGFTRYWWYEDYQDGLPYAQLTNLVRAARVERNWTNYYHLCRDNIPSPSARVWRDATEDLIQLSWAATPEQLDLMLNDPLLFAEFREWLQARQNWKQQLQELD